MQVILQGQTTPETAIYREVGEVPALWSEADQMLWVPSVQIPEGFTRIYKILDGRYMYPTEGFQLNQNGMQAKYVFGGHSFTRYRGCIACSFSYDFNQYGPSTIYMERFLLLP